MRALLFAVVMVEAMFNLGLVSSASARTEMTRDEIKATSITERPNRLGHFYGNTVRRRDNRGR